MAAGREILTRCIDAGGTITGEHGVGLEKQSFMPLIFSAADLDVMAPRAGRDRPVGQLQPRQGPARRAESRPTALPSAAGMPPLVAEGLWV